MSIQPEALCSDLVEFVECAIQLILYTRKIYPSNVFEQRKYLDVTVWQSRHPDINGYIRRVMDNARPLIEKVIKLIITDHGYGTYRAGFSGSR
jgi:hypothetical protein